MLFSLGNLRFDFVVAVVLISVAAVAALSYVIRVLVWGRVKYARVERQGGSVLLGTGLMSMAYWSLQPIGRLLVFLKVSPHVLSWSSLLLGIFAGLFLAVGRFGMGAIFATMSAFLDTLDGLVARMSGVASNTGEVLDTTVDRYCESFYLGGLVFFYRGEPMVMIMGLFALVGSFMVSYSTAKAEALGVIPERGIMRRPERAFYLIVGAALAPIGVQMWEANAARPMAYPMVAAIALVAVLTNISVIDRMWSIVRQLKIKEADPTTPEPEAGTLEPAT